MVVVAEDEEEKEKEVVQTVQIEKRWRSGWEGEGGKAIGKMK